LRASRLRTFLILSLNLKNRLNSIRNGVPVAKEKCVAIAGDVRWQHNGNTLTTNVLFSALGSKFVTYTTSTVTRSSKV